MNYFTRIRRNLGYYYRKLRHKKNHIYLVYSMGKVGSSTVYHELKRHKPFSDVFHTHFLSDYWLKERLPKEHKIFHSNITLGEKILNHIQRHPKRRIKMITLVREPVSRGISDLFENWAHKYENIEEVDQQKLLRDMESTDFDFALNWFDSEFKAYTNIDVFELAFSTEKGYAHYSFDQFDLLCIQLEKLSAIGSEALTQFINQPIRLKKAANQSNQKQTAEKYTFLKNHLKLSDAKLEVLYNSKLVRHFYSDQQIAEFKTNWRKS